MKFILTHALAALLLLSGNSVKAGSGNTDPVKRFKEITALNAKPVAPHVALRQVNLTSLPGKSMNYNPDGNGGWTHESNTFYQYYSDGKHKSSINLSAATNDSILKFTNAYDAQGNLSEDIIYQWSGSNWQIMDGSYKLETDYNASNQITQQIEKDYDSGTGQFENYSRTIVSYDLNGNLTEEFRANWENNAWLEWYKVVYTYNTSNVVTEMLLQDYVNGTYQNAIKITDLVWHTFPDKIASYVQQDWDSTMWQPSLRLNFTYDPNGGSVAVFESYENGNWHYTYRDTEVHDSFGNFTDLIYENYDSTGWYLSSHHQQVLTYNANAEITERIYRDSFGPNDPLSDIYRQVYSDFIISTPEAAFLNQPQLLLYPNPAHNQLYIGNLPQEKMQVTVTDIAGRQVLTEMVTAETPAINLSALQPGFYLVQVTGKAVNWSSKIIKE